VSEPFIGEIRIFGGNFAPIDWAFCDGSLQSISENDALFTLIGTTYGGDGVNTFALPDLRGRFPIHQGTDNTGNTAIIGQRGGSESVTVTLAQLPSHPHSAKAVKASAVSSPVGAAWSAAPTPAYTAPGANADQSTVMGPAAIASVGGGQPHENMSPYLGMNFIISLFGIFPSQG
jgi:microcystin-dependent protein